MRLQLGDEIVVADMAIGQHDPRFDDLAPFLVGNTDDSALLNYSVARQRVLHLLGAAR